MWTSYGDVVLAGDQLVMPRLPPDPGVYQWVMTYADAERRYVGEAKNLERRFAHYRSPGPSQVTNIRMNDRAQRVIAAGGHVEILCATGIQLIIDEVATEADLTLSFVRRFVENAALVALHSTGTPIINDIGYGEIANDVLR